MRAALWHSSCKPHRRAPTRTPSTPDRRTPMPLSRRQCLGAAALLTAAAAAPSWAQGSTPIPAHAGNSRTERRRHGQQPVHPRARGEQCRAARAGHESGGSFPRTRGTATRRWMRARRARFIPAHAGNSICAEMAAGRDPVHPRARGEQNTNRKSTTPFPGSSPRTRGTEAAPTDAAQQRRFIPAHAGNRQSACPAFLAKPVHPRARGEQA